MASLHTESLIQDLQPAAHRIGELLALRSIGVGESGYLDESAAFGQNALALLVRGLTHADWSPSDIQEVVNLVNQQAQRDLAPFLTPSPPSPSGSGLR